MINYLTGDILTSSADCLVNTVNCEGFMGKGIAYQFKLAYPENEKEYIKACKNGKLTTGKVFFFSENGKVIANFPTKDKWREDSKYEYIEKGMEDLLENILNYSVKSIAIPPLGCGNGGLVWITVKEIIEKYVKPLENKFDFYIYEPSKYYKAVPVKEPKMNALDLLLLQMKVYLQKDIKFSNLRLQKTGYFTDLFAGTDYFKFGKNKFGPYSHIIDISAARIRSFQSYYKTSNDESFELLKSKLISDSVTKVVEKYKMPILQATSFSNSIKDEDTLEIVSTLIALVKQSDGKELNDIIKEFYNWSSEKSRFSENKVRKIFEGLIDSNIFHKDLIGYAFNTQIINSNIMPKYISKTE